MKKILSIAGSDCSGGAGIQADLKTFSAHGVFGMTAITSIVAENTYHVLDFQNVHPNIIKKQIDAVFEDIPPDSIKIGMLSCIDSMIAVKESLYKWKANNIVIDPVMYAKNGCALMDTNSINTLIADIIPMANIITPNIPEAEKIAQINIQTQKDMEKAAICIYKMGCSNVLIKGGHMTGNATDILFNGTKFHYFTASRIDTKNTHGTGCTFSSAIASNIALGIPTIQSINLAKEYITTAIANALELGKGNGPTHHFYNLYKYGLEEDSTWKKDISH